MNKTLLVLKNEFLNIVTRRSFLLTLILLPVSSFIIILIISGIQKTSGIDAGEAIGNLFTPQQEQTIEGFVDYSGRIKSIPPGNENLITQFNSEEEAIQALHSGEISAYYLIPKDYLTSGEIFYIRPDFNPLSAESASSPIYALVAYNLLDGNLDLAYRLQNPINVSTVDLSGSQRDEQNWLTFFLPYMITFLFYIVILTSSSLMLNSVSTEKVNRVMEILITSVTPQELLTGKIIALGLTGLLQTIVWLGAGLLLLNFSGRSFPLAASIQLPPTILIWGIFFFLFGYAVYASLMAGIGALVPNLREGSQLTTLVIMPLVVPLIFISSLLQTPDSPLALFLSIFPLTSPVTMMTRLSATNVPIGQILLSLALLAGTAWVFVRASARLFKTQNLLTGQSMNVLGFIKVLIGH